MSISTTNAITADQWLVRVLVVFLLSVVFLVSGAWLFYVLAPAAAENPGLYAKLFLYPERLAPERQERQLFIFFVVALIPCVWSATWITTHWLHRQRALSRTAVQTSLQRSAWLLSLGILGSGIAILSRSELLYWLMPKKIQAPWAHLLLGISLFLGSLVQAQQSVGAVRFGLFRSIGKVLLTLHIVSLATAALLIFSAYPWSMQQIWFTACMSWVAVIAGWNIRQLLDHPPDIRVEAKLKQLTPRWLTLGICGFSAVAILLLRLKNLNFVVVDEYIWTTHFEAMFYGFSQTAAGQTLLADLPSQYGLAAELVRPFFAVFGNSVGSFSMLMLLLQIAAICALVLACLVWIEHPFLRFLSVGATLVLTLNPWAYSIWDRIDDYYQYRPLRLLFPAVSTLLLTWSWADNKPHLWATLAGVFAGLALAWNLDSSIPVAGTMLAWLLFRACFSSGGSRQRQGKQLTIYVLTLLATLALIYLWLQYKSGHRIDFSSAFRYQELFYRLGFYMLPMPRTPSAWMVVLSVYVFGICTATCLVWNSGQHTPASDGIFFMSILGIGLFTYYQGRSHELNLLMAMWPAPLVGLIVSDQIRKIIEGGSFKTRSTGALIMAGPVAFGLTCLLVLMFSFPFVTQRIPLHLETLTRGEPTPVRQNIDFIRTTSNGSHQVAIISSNQSVHFARTGLASAIPGPGLAEMVLVEDLLNAIRSITGGQLEHLYLQTDNSIPTAFQNWEVFRSYEIESGSGMLHLVPRRSAQPIKH